MTVPWPIAIILIIGVLCVVAVMKDPFNIDGDWYGKGRKK
jgi:hypothetical protein